MGVCRTGAIHPRLRRDRDHRAHHSRRQRLLKENQEDGHDQAQARRLAAAVRQVSDGPLRVHWPGGHFGRFAKLSGGSRAGGDGRPLKTAYEELEEEITACLREHRGNSSVASTMLNALLAWPDHPYGFGTLYG